jgi:predicted nucleic acid-binding protein
VEVILDTNALSALGNNDAALLKLLKASRQHFVPVVVLGEYRSGLRRSKYEANGLQWLDALEKKTALLDVTALTARHYGDIRHELRVAGNPIPINDLWIAALAREHGLAILSRDRHFDRVEGITRFDW